MKCDMAKMTICLLQKFSSDGLRQYWDGLPLQCTTRVSDGFVAHASRPKLFLALFLKGSLISQLENLDFDIFVSRL